jgi:Protein of unknown function (DUF2934)
VRPRIGNGAREGISDRRTRMSMTESFGIDPRSLAGCSAPRRVTDEEIARRAFELYCQRSRQDGHDLDDWLRAERECYAQGAADVPVRLRIKPDRRERREAAPGFDRRRPSMT